MKEIPLSQNRIALVDDEDFEELSQYKWHLYNAQGKTYALRSDRKNGKQTTVSMHRHLMKPPPNMVVDHTNRNGLDNRRSNLRVCTWSQNQMNRTRQHNSKSGVTGVTWMTAMAKWKATITVEKKVIHLGLFEELKDAAQARNAAAIKYFGEFAFIDNNYDTKEIV